MHLRSLLPLSAFLFLTSLVACSSHIVGGSSGTGTGGSGSGGSGSSTTNGVGGCNAGDGTNGVSGTGGSTGTGCGTAQEPPPITIDLSGYDRACTAASDCVLVVSGSVCGICNCPDGAINKDDEPQYNADLSEKEKLCPAIEPGWVCGACYSTDVECNAGQCTAVIML